MKDYKQLLRELPSSTIVCAVGDFDPPTVGHELLVKAVKRLAEEKKTPHVIFTNSGILQEDKKSQYLSLMFPKTTFKSLDESFSQSIAELKKKYKNVIVVSGSEQMTTLKKGLTESVEFISITEKDPDANDSKMKTFASKALYEQFKKNLPTAIRDIDGKRLMNDVRQGMGLEPIKEQINLVKDNLREQYFRGEIFNIGDIVESNGQQYEIVKRGSNHLLLKEEGGKLVSKWIQDVKTIAEGAIQPNGTDKVEVNGPEADTKEKQDDQSPKGLRKGFITFYNYNLKGKDDANNSRTGNNNAVGGENTAVREEVESIDELSNATLQSYKDKAMKSADELSAKGEHGKANDRLMNHMKASGKQIERTMGNIKKAMSVRESALNPDDPHGDYDAKRKALQDIQMDAHTSHDPDLTAELARRKADLEKEYEPHRKLKEAQEDAYTRDYKSSVTGFGKRKREDDEGYGKEKFKPKSTMDRPHTVHIDGKPWKKFPNGHQAHAAANTLKAKGKNAHAIAHFSEEVDKKDTITFDIPLLIRVLELAREDIKSDPDLHKVVEKLINIRDKGTLTMDDYAYISKLKEEYEHLIEEKPEEAADRKAQLKRFKDQAKCSMLTQDRPGISKETQPTFDPFFKEDYEVTEEDLESLIESAEFEDYLSLYEEDELALVYEDTGELVEDDEVDLMEVLSRTERFKSKVRFRKTAAKRHRATKIALHRYSPIQTVNSRARRLAVRLMKKRLLSGRDYANVSIGDKERIDKTIAKRKKVIDRLAAKLVSRVRGVERNRMSHDKLTKGDQPKLF